MRQSVAVMIEAAVTFHALIERAFSGMAERGMSQIVSQSDRFRQIFIEAELPAMVRLI